MLSWPSGWSHPSLGGKDRASGPRIALVCFAVIFLGELPDKTMFANLVMATRGRPGQVWLGAVAPLSPMWPLRSPSGSHCSKCSPDDPLMP